MKKMLFLLVTMLGCVSFYGNTPQPDNVPFNFPAPAGPPPPPPLPINENLNWLIFGAVLFVYFFCFKNKKAKSL